MENSTKTILVVSAHAADFVWRAGGAIALYASRGYKVRILCLSYGERGESQAAWKQPGMTIERVKEIRRAESTRAKLPWKWRASATNAAPRKSARARLKSGELGLDRQARRTRRAVGGIGGGPSVNPPQ
jgi:hypothetical protein